MGALHNTVKFFPRVAIIVTIEVNDVEPAIAVNHHITDVVVAMLIYLWSVFQ